MVLEAAMIFASKIFDGIAGSIQAVFQYQHSHPVPFLIMASLFMAMVLGYAYTQGTSVTGLVVGEYSTLTLAPEWYAGGVTDNLNVSRFKLVSGTTHQVQYFDLKEEFDGEDYQTWLIQRYYNSPCPGEFPNGSAVWEEVFIMTDVFADDPLGWLYSQITGGGVRQVRFACGGFATAIDTITFQNETQALRTIAQYANDGILCSDVLLLTQRDSAWLLEGCYFAVAENGQRLYWSTPPHQYTWIPVLHTAVPRGESNEPSFKTRLVVEQAGILTPFIHIWQSVKDLARSIESAASIDPPFISMFIALIEGFALVVTMIGIGIVGVVLVLSMTEIRK